MSEVPLYLCDEVVLEEGEGGSAGGLHLGRQHYVLQRPLHVLSCGGGHESDGARHVGSTVWVGSWLKGGRERAIERDIEQVMSPQVKHTQWLRERGDVQSAKGGRGDRISLCSSSLSLYVISVASTTSSSARSMSSPASERERERERVCEREITGYEPERERETTCCAPVSVCVRENRLRALRSKRQ